MPKTHSDAHGFEQYGELYSALETLPEDQRVPLVMKYCLGYSEQDIAGVLNLPKSTVKSRLFHARRKMRTEIAAYAKRGVL
jgi:RNA polymerase sigma-70 factor (ECF subfamily)